MDKSFNFEDAATQAAQLSQAFGLNIDALQQLQEQDPAKKLDNLRKAFFAAGRSIETMTAQERRLLAQQTGLDANSLDLAFSLKNQSLSYDQIQKKGEAAQKAQLTQAQALEKLSGAIERLVKSGQTFQGGFVDIFFQGFNTGIRRSADFRKVMHELRRDMHSTYRAGIQVGRAFVQMFPGIKDMLQGIAQIFEPRRFREMLQSIVGSFRMFFDALNKDPKTALPKLLDKMKAGFFNYFTNGSPGARQILEGAKKFFSAFASIGNSFLKIGLTEITSWMKLAVDLLSGRKSLNLVLSDGGFFGDLFKTLTDGLIPVLSNFWETFKMMLDEVWNRKLKPWLIKSIGPVLFSAFAPAALFGVTRAIGASIVVGIGKGILSSFGTDGKKITTSVASRLLGSANEALQAAPRAPQGIESSSNVLKAAASAQQAADSIKPSASIMTKLAFAAGLVAIGLAGLFAAIYGIRKFNVTVTRGELLNTAILVTSMVPLMGAVALASAGAKLISVTQLGQAIPALVVIGAVAAAMLASGAGAVYALKEFNFTTSDISKAGIMMAALSGFYIAASAVVGVATLVGAAVASGYGAAALAVGLASVGLTVEAMVLHGMRIMRKLNEFRPTSNFTQTASVFVNVMRAVGEFSKSIAAIASAMMPGIVSIVTSAFFGTNPQEQLRQTMGKFGEIIDAIGNNITRIIDNITNHLSSMDPVALERGRVFGDMLAGVAQLANAMSAPAELLKDTSAWWEDSDVTLKLTRFGQNIQGMGTSLVGIIRAVSTAIGNFGTLNASEGSVRASTIFSETLRGVGELARALSPSREVLDAMGRAVNGGRSIEALGSIIGQTVESMVNSGLFTRLTNFVRSIITETSSLTPQQLNQIRVVGPMITETMKAVAALVSGVSRGIPESIGIGSNTSNLITSFGRAVWGTMSSISQFIKGLLPSVVEIGSTIQARTVVGLKGITSILSPLFQTISDIPRIVTNFTGSIEADNEGRINEAAINSIGTRFGLISTFFQRIIGIFNSNEFRTSVASLGTLSLPRDLRSKMETLKVTLDTLNAIPATFSSLTRLSSGQESLSSVVNMVIRRLTTTDPSLTQQSIDASFVNVNNLITAINTGVTGINSQITSSNITANVETLVTEVRNSSISRISTTVSEMVDHINATSRQLASIRPININSELTRIAHNLGLNSEQTLRITEGRINLTINARILIEAEELETILIERPNSRIAST
jgi:enamine deaminase RidA (YjgF/YER057c/UK114 family)